MSLDTGIETDEDTEMTQYETTTKARKSGSRIITKTYYRHILPNGARSGWIPVNKKEALQMVTDGLAVSI